MIAPQDHAGDTSANRTVRVPPPLDRRAPGVIKPAHLEHSPGDARDVLDIGDWAS